METWKNYIDFDLRDGETDFVSVPPHENGTPFEVYHGLVVRFPLPAREYEEEEILDWFTKEFGGYFDQLREGFVEKFDSQMNKIGDYVTTQQERDALDTRQAIEEEIFEAGAIQGDIPGLEIWDAADWYLAAMSIEDVAEDWEIDPNTTDAELEEIAKRVREDALADNVALKKVTAFLERVREESEED